MELMEIIKTRRSIRKYLDKDVPDNIIEEAIEAASYAPNGGNYQGWKYVVIKNKEVLENIAKAVMDKLEAMVTWPEAAEYADIFARYKNNATFFKNAPACIAVFSARYAGILDKVLFARQEKNDQLACYMVGCREISKSGLQTIGAAVQNLILCLHNKGVASCWMTGPTIAKKEIEDLLPPQGDMDFVTLVPIGYAAEEKTTPPRKPVSEITDFLK